MSDRAKRVLDAVMAAVDREALSRALEGLGSASAAPAAGASGTGETAAAVLRKIVLSDILDDSILGARPGETSYPLRVFFGTLGDSLDHDDAFALANGINFFFRVGMDEEAKLVLGLEVSRLYYRFAEARLEADLVRPLSPLLARLMSTELSTVSYEAIDGARVFDSSLHERALGSNGSSPNIAAPKSFLCRVVSNQRVRVKAQVAT